MGKYIADFYCAKANMVIELDGAEQYKNSGLIDDGKRTEFLNGYGMKVVRISNLDILKNFEGVCIHIDNIIKQSLSQLR